MTQPKKSVTKFSTYQAYSGSSSNFPGPSEWLDYDTLWEIQLPALRTSNPSSTPGQDNPLIAYIAKAIDKVSAESGVDRRIILALIMQESTGNANAPTTNNGVRNPGIMQSHNGDTFDPANPEASILRMVRDGIEGTRSGDGIVQLLRKEGDVWRAMRAYNSGSVHKSGDLSNGNGSTNHYCSYVANRLLGWAGP